VDNSVDSSGAQPQELVILCEDAGPARPTTALWPSHTGARARMCRSRSGALGYEFPRKDADLCLLAEDPPTWLSTHVRRSRLGLIRSASTCTPEAHVVTRHRVSRSPVDNPVDEGGRGVRSGHHSGRSTICGCRKTALWVRHAYALPRSLSEIAPLASAHAGTVEVHVSSEKVSRETTRTNAFRGSRARLRW